MLSSFRYRRLAVMCGLVMIALVLSAPAFAQGRDTGTMSVRAVDPDGLALPGVTVLVSGPMGTRTQTTGVDGTARFPGLPPNSSTDTYTATFSLSGFSTVVREQLTVGVGRNVSLEVTLELSSVEETITVTGESPVVDVKATSVNSLYTSDMVDMAPTASGIWAGVLDHVPGIVQNNFDVGGGASGSQSLPTAYGSDWNQNSYTINGADATDPAAIGATSYFSTHAFEEVSVGTAAHDMESQTPGVMINMVVKNGSNDWHGGVKAFYENDGMVSNNVKTPELEERVGEGNPNTYLLDYDLQVGGPILRDRAWFFVDYWNFETRRIIIGVPEEESTTLEDWTISGTAQLNEDHKFTARWISNRKLLPNRGASRNNPLNGFIQDFFMDIPQLQWQGVFGGNAFADIRFSKQDIDFPQTSRTPGSRNPFPNFIDQPNMYDYGEGQWVQNENWRATDAFNLRDTASLNGTVSYYLTGENMSHDIKVGGGYIGAGSFNPRFKAFGYTPEWDDYAARVEETVYLYATPAVDRSVALNGKSEDILGSFEKGVGGTYYNGTRFNVFAQDSLTWGNRVTLNLGVRFDTRWNWNPEQVRPESFFPELGEAFQEAVIPQQPNAVKWDDLTGRFSVVYDLMGDGRTALKANFSQYSQQLGVTEFAGTINQNGTGNNEYEWTDTNGNGEFDYPDELGALVDFSRPGITSGIDSDAKSPRSTEFSFGVEHELFDGFLVSGTGIFRDTSNLIDGVNVGRPFGPILGSPGCAEFCTGSQVDPYVPIQTTDPGPDGIFGTADDGGAVTVYGRDTTLSDPSFFVTGNAEKFGYDKKEEFKGIELVASKRWSNNWQVLGSYNWGIAESNGNLGNSPNGDFNGRLMRSSGDRTHIVKITGNYLIAEPIGVNLGMFYRMYSGQPQVGTWNYSRTFLEDLSGNDNLAGSVTLSLGERGVNDLPGALPKDPTTHIMDIRAEKQVTIGRYGVAHFYFDVFNVFNVNTTTSFRTRYGTPRYGEINAIIPPRVIRIGGAFDF